jgi:hypothetical protein
MKGTVWGGGVICSEINSLSVDDLEQHMQAFLDALSQLRVEFTECRPFLLQEKLSDRVLAGWQRSMMEIGEVQRVFMKLSNQSGLLPEEPHLPLPNEPLFSGHRL